ncbi:type IV toxin-antitoxin system AbiEi family antitoxin domain-containing protein [Kribbella sp. CA-293567]|uniref:type IV toxin-antitoxin system AbiEi family antitoxin domain-containing protein n=1 Tax=Kribbella sp. CA-293567 TaxID=3002436 RepID=UPI0022DD04A7|nr:type IV toxin-antitoxin system AbiEi family antitoxin domain-containing protein [Kribbella sp. CA-293567]WBQ04984.1 type IV toxin-antitoxin system AbiEi family antitoxin domain-containing protein [Kribbella sp. CA-293567]
MKVKLQVVAEKQGGVFSREDALRCGYSPAQIRVEIRDGAWLRVCRGQYTAARSDADEPPWVRSTGEHRLATRAVLRSLTGSVVLSHQSAIVEYGLPTWGLDLSRVHVTRRDGVKGRITRKAVQHNAQLPAGIIWCRDGREVVAPERAVLEVACSTGFEPALAIADEALRIGLVTRQGLAFALCDVEHWPRSPAARQVVAFCNGLSESVGESRLRVLMDDHGLPTPVLQAPMLRNGTVFARVDFLFPQFRTVIEFDGLLKYSTDPEVLVREKHREDSIRELGYQVLRLTWHDLSTPDRTIARIQQAFTRAGYPQPR